MQTTVSNHIPYSYAYTAGLSGRIAIPVSPSQLPYAYFKNVSGVATQSNAVYSLDKLKILDTIIDRLRSVKRDAPEPREAGQSISPERIDALIEQYGKQLHTALTAATIPYAKPQGVSPGMLVSVAA